MARNFNVLFTEQYVDSPNKYPYLTHLNHNCAQFFTKLKLLLANPLNGMAQMKATVGATESRVPGHYLAWILDRFKNSTLNKTNEFFR